MLPPDYSNSPASFITYYLTLCFILLCTTPLFLHFKTEEEERQYNTIPGSAIATHIALSYSRVQANPTVERGPPQQKVKTKKPSAEETKIETSST